ncbi:Katanin p80 wd40 repeat-containing subunit b1-like protein [Thalictrum thalictroides]|uniref:Katanin p80 wd40 repeat-containing subunit b1-like protein n=1 Tax=Thalictrum thalictroides TaxID=46969 RepID=A0A7J6WJ53_THATH|nr:Katanin p80 wd40 repeat-containing subunit b1-like protein [Thalictrum thalictroides]
MVVIVLRTLTGHRSSCNALQFHPFGEFFASGSSDASLKIWDARKKGCIHTYKGHTRGVNTIRFTPDGRWVVSGGADNIVKIWDLTAGKLLHEFKFHEGQIQCIEFHPLEFLLATGSADKTVKFWDLETFEMIGSVGPEQFLLLFKMVNQGNRRGRDDYSRCPHRRHFTEMMEMMSRLAVAPQQPIQTVVDNSSVDGSNGVDDPIPTHRSEKNSDYNQRSLHPRSLPIVLEDDSEVRQNRIHAWLHERDGELEEKFDIQVARDQQVRADLQRLAQVANSGHLRGQHIDPGRVLPPIVGRQRQQPQDRVLRGPRQDI